MTTYAEMTAAQLKAAHDELQSRYNSYCAKGLDLNMARGKPSTEQLDLSLPMLDVLNSKSDLTAADGTDCRNYGVLTGLPEARAFMGEVLEVSPEQVIIFGNASLNVMYDIIARAVTDGIGDYEAWSQLDSVKFLCPVPGYDRHFSICEHFDIEMICIPMTEQGPDMDEVERLVASDASIKGMWCVPKYSNPQGYTYSDETVRRIAALEPAAGDFRVIWDNAYCVHHLNDDAADQDRLLNILEECERAGHPDLVLEVCSTSKITFPGSGISALAASPANIAEITRAIADQTISHDKLNQLRHVRYLENAAGLAAHMAKHAALLRPKFQTVFDILERDLAGTGVGAWTTPRGGYFISFDGPENSAKAIVAKAAEAGVKMTGAGATYPYGLDPHDSNIRIAPSFPSIDELAQAADIFTICVRLVALEQLMD